jgi:predicted transcriptional regulator
MILGLCFPLYEKGYSVGEIERQTGIPKSSVRDALTKRGLTLRRFTKAKQPSGTRTTSMRSGTIPYGYRYLEGELVKNPTEYKIVVKIMNNWNKGKSFHAITRLLNDSNTPTRSGIKWVHSVVGRIIKSHNMNNNLEKTDPSNNI